jgi:hypothetical protein
VRWADGRRRFGTVSAAIVEVLNEADGPLRVREIRSRVEQILGGPVSRHSIKSQLHRGCQHQRPRFNRLARGVYRLHD